MLRARLGASVLVDSRIGWRASSAAAGKPVRQEARRALVPQHAGRAARAAPRPSATTSSRCSSPSSLLGDAGDDLLGRRPRRAGRNRRASGAQRSALDRVGDVLVEQAHAVAGRALVVGRARPCPTRPCRRCRGAPSATPFVDEALEELRRGDRPALARADILHVGDRRIDQPVDRLAPAAGATACRRSPRRPRSAVGQRARRCARTCRHIHGRG